MGYSELLPSCLAHVHRSVASLPAISVALLLPLAASTAVAQTENQGGSKLRDAANEVVVPGTVEGLYQTDIMSRLEGYVGEVLVDIGDQVKKGDRLLVIDAPEVLVDVTRSEKVVQKSLADVAAVEAELASIQAQESALQARRSLRQSELDRITKLVDSGAVTGAKGDEAKYSLQAVLSEKMVLKAQLHAVEANGVASQAAVEVARADLAHAQAMKNYLTIRAPFDGVVTRRNVDPGAYVRPPTADAKPLLHLESVDRVRLVVMVPYASARRLAIGDEVKFSGLRGRSGVVITGRITRTGFGFEPGSRMMRAEVELDNRPHPKTGRRRLRSGEYGTATIRLGESGGAAGVPANRLGPRPEGRSLRQLLGDLKRRAATLLAVQDGFSLTDGGFAEGHGVDKGVDSVE